MPQNEKNTKRPFDGIKTFSVFAPPADRAPNAEENLFRGRYLYYTDKNIITVFNLSICDATALAEEYGAKRFCFCVVEKGILKATLWGTRGPLRLEVRDGKAVLAPQDPGAKGRRPVAAAPDINLSDEKAGEAFRAIFTFFGVLLSFELFLSLSRAAKRIISENQKLNALDDVGAEELLARAVDKNSTGFRRYAARAKLNKPYALTPD